MISPTQKSNETEPQRTAPPTDAGNADKVPVVETAQTNPPEKTAKTQPENARTQADSQKPNRPDPGSSEPREPRPRAPEQAESEPDDPKIMMSALMLASPPLAAGESLDDYAKLIEQIEKAVNPQNFFDFLRVCDLGHALLEERRYRKQQVALPNATRFKALIALVIQVSPNFQIKASDLALDYFGTDRERRDRAERFLLRHDITDDAITAQAAEMHAQTIGALERMVGNRQNLRNRVVKEVERDKRKAEKKKAKRKPEDSGPATGTTH
jgi:hypothetical protein